MGRYDLQIYAFPSQEGFFTTMSTQQSDALSEGIRYLQAGDMQAAIGSFAQVLHEDQSNAQAWGYLGIAQSRTGDLAAGISSLQYAAHLQPDSAGAHYNLAVALMQAQRAPEAKAMFEHVLAIDPNHAQAQAGLQHLAVVAAPAQPQTAPPPDPDISHAAVSSAVTDMDLPPPSSTPAASGPVDLSGQPIGASAGPVDLSGQPLGMPSSAPTAASLPPLPGPAPGMMSQGMRYDPRLAARPTGYAPPTGLRITRGLGWGALYGQWWTAWYMFWNVVWGATKSDHVSTLGIVIVGVCAAVIFGVVGSLVGLIIGAANTNVKTGIIIGIVAGLLFCGLEILLGGGMMVVNVIFWYFTGRYVGFSIARRVLRPVTG